MPVQFGSVKIVMQSKALAGENEYNRKAHAIRQKIRGNLEVLGPDPEVYEAIHHELGSYDAQPERNAAEKRFKQYLEELPSKHAGNPDYQAMMFPLGNVPNPLNPSQSALQKLVVDGDDIQRLQKDTFNDAFFTKATYPQPERTLKLVSTALHNSSDHFPGDALKDAFNRTLDQYSREIEDQVANGNTDNVLDLDA